MNHLPQQPPAPVGPDSLTPLQRTFMALERTRGRLAALEDAASEPVAIIGMACRVPGADTPDAFWDLMRNATDAITPVPPDRWDHTGYVTADAAEPGRIATHAGGFLRGVDQFDASFFGISVREANAMDPQQRLLLEVAWEALEHAGTAPDSLHGTEVGVYVGAASNDYAYLQIAAGDPALLDGHYTSGIAQSVLSGRLSYLLGLQGPSLTVDTACSSSLVAVHLACQALRNADCRLALAGGVNVILAPQLFVALSRAHMLAPDGRCKTFDASADGFARGEGCGVVVLKRLSDAISDGDRVLALIRGSAVNQDGPSSSLSAPNGPAQAAVIRRALERAGVKPHHVGYIEAHGTGTALGDPLEVGAIGAVFGGQRSGRLMLGSVKTNIGHLEGAAGIAGLIKLVLALRHRTIPAHLHFREPSPHIPWSDLPVEVPVAATPWPVIDGTRIGGVSAFGFSGTNAHVVVEAPRPDQAPVGRPERPSLLALSARTPASLAEQARRLDAALFDQPLADICRTVNAGRAQLGVRATILADSREGLRAGLLAVSGGTPAGGVRTGGTVRRDPPRIAFLFTGQGAQHAGMARGLYDASPVFRKALDSCAGIADPLLGCPLLDVIFADGDSLDRTEFTQPALFAVEYALTQLWAACGVQPAVVIGHSVGEYVAACLAGVFSLQDGLRLIARRGRLMQSLPPGGAMAAVAAPESTVAGLLLAGVWVAAVNGPAQTVIAGAAPALRAVCDRCAACGIASVPLPVSHAFHSGLVDPVLDAFESAARDVTFAPPRLRLISNLTGNLAEPGALTQPGYWRRHMRETVRFADGLRALAEAGPDVCIEIGPHPVLLDFAKANGALHQATLLPSLRRGRPDMTQFLDSLGALFMEGARIDWSAIAGDGRVTDLPSYPFERRRHWFHARPKGSAPPVPGGHALLGATIPMAVPGRFYEARTGAGEPWFLRDHAALGSVVLPAAAYLEMLLTAASNALGAASAEARAWSIEEVTIGDAMVLPEHGARVVQTVLDPVEAGTNSVGVAISSRPDSHGQDTDGPKLEAGWTRHVTARIRRAAPAGCHFHAANGSLQLARGVCVTPVDVPAFYDNLGARGMAFGPAFRGVISLWRGEAAGRHHGLGEVVLPDRCAREAASYLIHPALLDGCLQVMAVCIAGDADALFLPIAVGAFTLFATPPRRCWSHVVVEGGYASRRASVRVFADDGRAIAALDDVVLRRVARDTLDPRDNGQDINEQKTWLWRTRWRKLPPLAPAPSMAGREFVFLADAGGLADTLAAELPGATVLRGDIERPGLWSASQATDVVDLRPLDAKDGVDAAADCCATVQALLTATPSPALLPRLWIVTAGGQSVTGTETALFAARAALWGLARTIRLEHPDLRPVSIDLDPDARAGWTEALLTALAASGAETERALRAAEVFVPRLTRHRPVPAAAPPDAAWRLVPDTRGTFDGFHREAMARRAPGPGEVEIAVHATGLNFRDVLSALDLYPGASPPLGCECAGVITQAGPGAAQFQPGDKVLAVAADCLASHAVAPAGMVRKLPPHVSMAEAAAFPIAFITASVCLCDAGRLKPGERVLVHAGAGGVGMAAIRTAQCIGAEVFATAGSPFKRDLLRAIGVAHVFDSRSPAFADQVLVATGGCGVDLVLNSLSGDMLEAGFRAVARGGRFVEIGKRGIKTAAEVAAMARDIEYAIIDWSETARSDPASIEAILTRLADDLGAGRIASLPRHVFPVDEAAPAFRMMAQGRHVGRIVLAHPVAAAGESARSGIRGDGTYLVTGGLSGLGLEVARFLGARGAGRLVLIGRRGETAESATVIAQLRAGGDVVQAEALDVADVSGLSTLLSRLRQDGPPLRGVIHAAGVLENGTILNQGSEWFHRVAAPKLGGAEALGRLTRPDPLDFMVLFSSVAGTLGAPGQANYAAANAALDMLAIERRRDGLPALAIAWGAWSGTGMAASTQAHAFLSGHGIAAISPAQGLRVLESLLTGETGALVAAPVDWRRYIDRVCGGQVPALLTEVAGPRDGITRADTPVAGGQRPPAGRLIAQLEAAPQASRRVLLETFVRERVTHALGADTLRPLDAQVLLGDIGLDSLLAIELRNTLSAALDRKLPATLLFDHPTIAQLTGALMAELPGMTADAEAPTVDTPKAGLIKAVAGLSDDEIERELAARVRGGRRR